MLQHNLLDELPVEVLETIVQLLGLRDVRKLRLTNTSLSAKTSKGHFKTYFSRKKIQVYTDDDLRQLVQLTQNGWMGTLLQDLVVSGRVHADPRRRTIPCEGATELLGEAFSNVQRNSVRGGLNSLTLTVETCGVGGKAMEIQKIKDWRQVWNVAASTFQITVKSLQLSELPVKKIDIFGDVLRCSLAIDRFATGLSELELSTLQELSLNLSNHVLVEGEDEQADPLQLAEQHTNDVCRFLQACPSLRSLKLRWYKIKVDGPSPALTEEEDLFHRLATSVDFGTLRNCSLFGLHVQIADLLNLLRTTHLERLSIGEINLPHESWGQVFDQIVRQENLEYLDLENLYEGNRPIYFDAPGEPPYPLPEPIGPISLTREGEDARRPVVFNQTRLPPFDSAALSRWRARRAWMRGPP